MFSSQHTTPDSQARQNNATLCARDPVVAFQTERLLEKRAGAICRIVRSHVMKMVGFAQHHLKTRCCSSSKLPKAQIVCESFPFPCCVRQSSVQQRFQHTTLVGSGSGTGPMFTPKKLRRFYDTTFPVHCGHARCKMTMQPVAQSVALVSRCGSC